MESVEDIFEEVCTGPRNQRQSLMEICSVGTTRDGVFSDVNQRRRSRKKKLTAQERKKDFWLSTVEVKAMFSSVILQSREDDLIGGSCWTIVAPRHGAFSGSCDGKRAFELLSWCCVSDPQKVILEV